MGISDNQCFNDHVSSRCVTSYLDTISLHGSVRHVFKQTHSGTMIYKYRIFKVLLISPITF